MVFVNSEDKEVFGISEQVFFLQTSLLLYWGYLKESISSIAADRSVVYGANKPTTRKQSMTRE